MSVDTSIEWTDATWNPVRGCSRVSAGCENCYAEAVARRFSAPGQPYEGLVRLGKDGKAKAQWNGTIRFVNEHVFDPLRWRKPRRIFVNSMSDLFHEALTFERIAAIFGVMASAPQHTFQVLTKRPLRAAKFFAWLDEQRPEGNPLWECLSQALALETAVHPDGARGPLHTGRCADCDGPWPLPNVWLGVSVEDQKTADERIPVLLELPAAIRWVSYEPALGPVDWHRTGGPSDTDRQDVLRFGAPMVDSWIRGLDWIVVGGESGPRARPFAVEWAHRTILQCRDAGVACFVKQLGAMTVTEERPGLEPGTWGWSYPAWADRKGGDPREWARFRLSHLNVRQWPEVDRG